ncbi:MAG: helix-turn-helix domain-containing protein [Candidatus Hydrogenedentes bacterium]|nr:helix-turn-helix domain-containing protein [Candidatus Hydrogenedentota bacterium]
MSKAGEEILQGANEALSFLRGDKTQGRAHAIINSTIDVKRIRAKTGLSQAAFAETYGLSLHSLKKWETGIRTPEGAAKAYLTVIAQRPEVVKDALWSAV